jgi:hypothetical protein
MLRGTFVALVSAALLLAGCGDDDSGVSTASDQETADKAIAAVQQALRDDGFAASPDDENDNDLSFQSEECQEFEEVAFPESDQELPGETARARSGSFDRGRLEPTGGIEESIRAGVTFVEEPKDLDPFFEMLNDERLGPCLEEAMRIAFEEGADESQEAVKVGDVEIEQLGGDGLGDAGGGLQGTTEIMTPAATLLLSFAAQSVRVDRAVVAVGTVAVGTDEPTVDRAALLQVLVDAVSDQST